MSSASRSKSDNEELRAARRREILEAATKVFANKGIASTKVTEIAAAANLSHGLLYHYFPSKEAVFEAIVDEMMQRTDEDLEAPQARAIDRLRHMMSRALERLDDHCLESRIVTHALLMRECISSELHARLSAHLDHALGRTRETIAQAQADGDLDDEISPDELSRTLLFLFRGMAVRVPGFEIPLPEVDTILALLRPGATPGRGKRKPTT